MPLFLRERPSNSLFPWSKKSEQVDDDSDTVAEETIEAEAVLPWEADHPEEFTQARWVATNLHGNRISPAALVLSLIHI